MKLTCSDAWLGWCELNSTAEIWKIRHIPEKIGLIPSSSIVFLQPLPPLPITTLRSPSSSIYCAPLPHCTMSEIQYIEVQDTIVVHFSRTDSQSWETSHTWQWHSSKWDVFSLYAFPEVVLVSTPTTTASTISCVRSIHSSQGDIWNLKSPEKIPIED